jgi:hypothetical protein
MNPEMEKDDFSFVDGCVPVSKTRVVNLPGTLITTLTW